MGYLYLLEWYKHHTTIPFTDNLMYKPIKAGRIYEKIVEQIEQQILSGNLAPGDKLPSERELGEQFEVSRTAVREAMKILRQRGLVEINPGRGTFVIDSTTQAMRQSLGLMVKIEQLEGTQNLVEVREIIEPEIAALAARRATTGDIAAMSEAIAAMEDALDSIPVNIEAFIEADLDFHLALAEGTQNALVPVLIDTLIDVLRELRKRTSKTPGGLERAQHHHKLILQAVERRDPDEARECMRSHMQQVREDSEASLLLNLKL